MADWHAPLPALGMAPSPRRTLVAAGQCTKVNLPPSRSGRLLGCGVMWPAIGRRPVHRGGRAGRLGGRLRLRWRRVRRHRGSKLAGAAAIIAIDKDAKKLDLATAFGATHTVDAGATDPVEAIRGSPAATAPTSALRRSGTRS